MAATKIEDVGSWEPPPYLPSQWRQRRRRSERCKPETRCAPAPQLSGGGRGSWQAIRHKPATHRYLWTARSCTNLWATVAAGTAIVIRCPCGCKSSSAPGRPQVFLRGDFETRFAWNVRYEATLRYLPICRGNFFKRVWLDGSVTVLSRPRRALPRRLITPEARCLLQAPGFSFEVLGKACAAMRGSGNRTSRDIAAPGKVPRDNSRERQS
jgi:hypothetical protein